METSSTHKKLIEQVSEKLRLKGYSYSTETTYLNWIDRYLHFHDQRPLGEMGVLEIQAFLTHLVVKKRISASTYNQALSALLFLYRQVLEVELQADFKNFSVKRPNRLPTVLSRAEIQMLIDLLNGVNQLILKLLYGAGLRISECLRLRVKDIDLDAKSILVRDSKEVSNRFTILPETATPDLLERVRLLHQRDLARATAGVSMPGGLNSRKLTQAGVEWPWQYLFPAADCSKDPLTDQLYRHHLQPNGVQKAVRKAARQLDIGKPVTPHTFRHSFAAHLLESGHDIRKVQQLLGHKNIKSTLIYTQVVDSDAMSVKSPLDI